MISLGGPCGKLLQLKTFWAFYGLDQPGAQLVGEVQNSAQYPMYVSKEYSRGLWTLRVAVPV